MGDWTPPEERFSELPLRLLTAGVLIPFALLAVWNGSWWLAAGCAAFCAAMMLEWCGMSGAPHSRWLALLAAAFGLSLGFDSAGISLALLACAATLAAATSRSSFLNALTGMFGVIYVFAMVGGLYVLREGPWDGRTAAIYFMSFVWASDAAAYFFGRLLRGPRLLPKESPNKTWSGAVAGVGACLACGALAANLQSEEVGYWLLAGAAVSVIAQTGDLFESGLKRRFNVKDSGTLLPGHGGLLDRVDGLGAVSIVASALFIGVPAVPRLLGF